jgi:glutathione S-transferase
MAATLRQAQRGDIPGMHRVRLAVRENRLVSGVTPADCVPAIEETGRGWVVEDDGTIVGFAVGNASDGNIWALFVDPAHEGRGHGRRLHDAMVEWLFSRGLQRLWLSTEPGTRAQAFYEVAGWTHMGMLGNGEARYERSRPMYTVYGMKTSGNCYKVQLLLAQLGIAHHWEEVDIMTGITRKPGFLAWNPNGRVPTLEIEPGVYLPESNAILCYLADGTAFWPPGRLARAQVLQWMFFEQYSHEPYVAVARFICKFLPADHPRRTDLPRVRERAHQALAVMEKHLDQQPFFVGRAYSIADIALFAYTHAAGDGGIELDGYPAINGWIGRVKAQPRFIPMVPMP